MNSRNGLNLTAIALAALVVVALIAFWILNSIWNAANARAEELVLLGQHPDVTTAMGQAVIDVIMVPFATAALPFVVLFLLGAAAWKWLQGVARQF